MMGATYYKEMAMALPGQVSDTSRYNIDGACVLKEASVAAGLAVRVDRVGADGVKQIKAISASNEVPYGVAIRSHFATQNSNGAAVYVDGDGVNVMTVGRVWMRADSDFTPGFGTPVYIKHTTGEAAYSNAQDAIKATGWTFAGGKTKFGSMNLVEVQLHQL